MNQKTENTFIIMLSNSIYYFLQFVFIRIDAPDQCTLVVNHNNRLLCDREYKTKKGAKIAFSKLFKEKAWKKNVKPDWTDEYNTDAGWLQDKLSAPKAE